MDGGNYDDFAQARGVREMELRSDGRPRAFARTRRASARTAGSSPTSRTAERVPEREPKREPTREPKRQPKPFHYSSERTLMLGQLADMLPPGPALVLSADARRLPVVGVRLTSRSGAAVHAAPTLTDGALFVDHRDLAALDAGALVPDLAIVVGRVR